MKKTGLIIAILLSVAVAGAVSSYHQFGPYENYLIGRGNDSGANYINLFADSTYTNTLDCGNAPGAQNCTFEAGTLTALTQFSGPGTGLTGTASSLSIGGNAATATAASGLTGNPAIQVVSLANSQTVAFTGDSGTTSLTCATGYTCSPFSGAVTFTVAAGGITNVNLLHFSWASGFAHVAACTFNANAALSAVESPTGSSATQVQVYAIGTWAAATYNLFYTCS